jgi:multiple sugar transport system permease protein
VIARTDRPSRLRRACGSEHAAGWGFVLPAAILVGTFQVVPVVWSFVLSLQRTDLSAPGRYVGADNYRRLLHDPAFGDAIRRTLVYSALFVPITLVGALAIAVLLNRAVRGIALYRTAVFVPVVTSTIATGVIFAWLLDPDFGVVNGLLGAVGIPRQGFFHDPDQALYAIVGITVWGWLGFGVIIYLAALQGVPRELVEAAEVDGASRWRTFRRVELPLLAPASVFLLVWLTINALQLFDEINVTTQGGPLHATTVAVYYLYEQAFQLFHFGYATAIAYVVFVAIFVVSAVQLWLSRRAVDYTT